jgi:hypothetical protein
MQKVGFYYWVRATVMFATLVGVIVLMYRLNISLTSGPAGSVQICPTRVSSVSVIGRAAVFQEDLRWYRAQAGGREELNPIAVEKWFSEYCTVSAEAAPAPSKESVPVLTVAYVAGLPVTLRQSEDVFTLGNIHFRSAQLKEAIDALTRLPAKNP